MSKYFLYDAYDEQGAKVSGSISASSKSDAMDKLQADNLIPISIKEKSTQEAVSLFKPKVSLKDLEFFTSELSLLLRSGLKIDKAIAVLAKSKSEPALKALLTELLDGLKAGKSLSQVFKEKDDVFDPLYCNLIELGEETGNLSEVFSDLAKDLAFKKELKSKIIGALTYPMVIFSVCIMAVLFIFNVIIPKMSVMFTDIAALPWYTQLLIALSEWMQNYQVFLFLGLLLSAFGVHYALKAPTLKHKFQTLLLRLPVSKTLIINVERIRFNSALAMMLKSGISIDRALQLGAGSIKNSELQSMMNVARKKIKNGTALTSSLGQTPFFTGLYISLLEVGEQTGTLDIVFEDIAQRSKTEFNNWTNKVTTLLEPLMILFMGGIVGSVVVVMLLSMVSVNEVGL